MDGVIFIVTATFQVLTQVITSADPIINPLSADATMLTYLIDIGVFGPLAFSFLYRMIGLGRGG